MTNLAKLFEVIYRIWTKILGSMCACTKRECLEKISAKSAPVEEPQYVKNFSLTVWQITDLRFSPPAEMSDERSQSKEQNWTKILPMDEIEKTMDFACESLSLKSRFPPATFVPLNCHAMPLAIFWIVPFDQCICCTIRQWTNVFWPVYRRHSSILRRTTSMKTVIMENSSIRNSYHLYIYHVKKKAQVSLKIVQFLRKFDIQIKVGSIKISVFGEPS